MAYGLEVAHTECEECKWCAEQALKAIRRSASSSVTTFAAEGDCYGFAFRETAKSYAALWSRLK